MRLAISLEAHGFLAHQPDGSYRLDAEVLRLGSIYQQSFRLEAHVMPVLEALVAATGESASFYIRRGEQRLCLFRVDSPHPLRMHVRQGDMLPMDGSAIAQVLRAFGAVPLPAGRGKAGPAALHRRRERSAHRRHGHAGVRPRRGLRRCAVAHGTDHPTDARGRRGSGGHAAGRRKRI